MTVLDPVTFADFANVARGPILPRHPDAQGSVHVEAFVMDAPHDVLMEVVETRQWAWAPANRDAFRRELARRHAHDPNGTVLADADNCICINCARPASEHDEVFSACPERPDDAA